MNDPANEEHSMSMDDVRDFLKRHLTIRVDVTDGGTRLEVELRLEGVTISEDIVSLPQADR